MSIPNHLTDAELEKSIARRRHAGLPARFDEIMLGIHPEDRAAAGNAEAEYRHMAGDAGRPSDALRSVSSQFRKAERR